MPLFRAGLSAFTILLTALAANAQSVPGQQETDFTEARALWLGGEDLAALAALAEAARADNVAARMLLSRIADSPWLHAHATDDLPRRERIALLRREEGLSGKDWMETAAEGSALAAAFWQLDNPTPGVPFDQSVAEALMAHGEDFAAFRVLNQHLVQDPAAAGALAVALADRFEGAGPWLLSNTMISLSQRDLPIPWPSHVTTDAEAQAYFEDLRQVANGLSYSGPLLFSTVAGVAVTEPEVAGWLETAPELVPLRQFCAMTCPGAEAACRVSASRRLPFPHPFASPMQSVVPDVLYWESPRINDDILRRLVQFDWPGCAG